MLFTLSPYLLLITYKGWGRGEIVTLQCRNPTDTTTKWLKLSSLIMGQTDIIYLPTDVLKRTQHHITQYSCSKRKTWANNKGNQVNPDWGMIYKTGYYSLNFNVNRYKEYLRSYLRLKMNKEIKELIIMKDPGLNPKSRKEKNRHKRHSWNNCKIYSWYVY